MFVDYTDAQKALRKEFRAYFSSLITPEYREELRNAESGELYKQLIRQQGKDGMLAVGWPEKYGGRGLTESEQLIRYEEALICGAPTPFVTLNTVGPAIMSRGTDEQKQRFLPGIASGELHFSIGYSEPAAGTDLDAERLDAYCREHLAPYKRPRSYEFMDGLPRTAVGKIDKLALRRRTDA